MPRYTHDCDECRFLGSSGQWDCYYCEKGGERTLIGRFGDDGSEYVSGLKIWPNSSGVARAAMLAVNAGVLSAATLLGVAK